jgi:lipopolysaccharide exporter
MTERNPRANLIRGAAWTVATRWIIKGIGFINTVVMARILVPEDYGLVAIAMLMVGLIQTFLDFGATVSLLRKDKIDRADIDSAWTLRLMQGSAAGIALILLAPLSAYLMHEPRLSAVLLVMGGCIWLASLQNIGPTLAQKEFNFALGFKIETSAKVVSVAVTIGLGLWLRNHWALVGGIVAGYITPLLLSYVFHTYRPRFDVSRFGEIWAVTKWLLLGHIGAFVLRRGDELAAAKLGGAASYGFYNVGADFGGMPVSEVGPAMLRALLPVLSSIQDDIERTRLAVIKTTAVLNGVIWPISFGFAAVSLNATQIVLGPKWSEAAAYVAIFSLVSALLNSTSALRTMLTLRAYTKVQSQIVWGEFVVFALAAFSLYQVTGLLGLGYARLIAASFNLLATCAMAIPLCEIRFKELLLAIGRPFFASLAMYLVVQELQGVTSHPGLDIGVSILVGGCCYVLTLIVLWVSAGRPVGVERLGLELWQRYRETKLSS